MKNIKMRLLTMVACLFTLTFAIDSNAQKGGDKSACDNDHKKWWGHHKNFNPDSAAQKQTEHMKKDLALTSDQESKVQEINLKYAKKKKESMEEIHKNMEAMHKDKEQELSQVLTKEQNQKYLEEKKKRDECPGKNHEKPGTKRK